MTNITKIIEDKAREYASVFSAPHRVRSFAGFTAGASFATSDPLILQSLLQPFAEWINERYCNDGDLKLWRELGTLNYYSDEELIEKYIQFITDKQKEE